MTDRLHRAGAPDSQFALEFRFLGHFAIRAADGWRPGPSPKKGRELIQYLAAFPRRVATRDELATAFWPDLDSDAISHRVHLAASGARTYLRPILDGYDAIVCASGGYMWDPQMRIVSDVDTFLAECRQGTPAALEAAIARYGGELLAGETADWLLPLRVRCATSYACAIERLAEEAMRGRDYVRALAFGLDLLTGDPCHEGATRLTMRCFAALGRRGRALEQYHALCVYLDKHLSLEPTDETAALAAELSRTNVRSVLRSVAPAG